MSGCLVHLVKPELSCCIIIVCIYTVCVLFGTHLPLRDRQVFSESISDFISAQINPGTGESNTKHSDSAGFSRISLSACVLLQQVLPEWCSKLELKFFCTAGSSKLD